MIEYIDGKITYRNPAFVAIDIGGLGYHIKISLYTYEKIVDVDQCKLYIHLAIKEDAHILYGFFEEEERQMFRNLISVSGIGTNTGILILSSLKVIDLKNAIISGNISLLKSIKGVGPKTAQRMVIELQDSLKKGSPDIPVISASAGSAAFHESVSALVMLGFKKLDAEKVVMKIMKDHQMNILVEEIIKLALKNL
jgi:holliday junction DNA helicase RuvA